MIESNRDWNAILKRSATELFAVPALCLVYGFILIFCIRFVQIVSEGN